MAMPLVTTMNDQHDHMDKTNLVNSSNFQSKEIGLVLPRESLPNIPFSNNAFVVGMDYE